MATNTYTIIAPNPSEKKFSNSELIKSFKELDKTIKTETNDITTSAESYLECYYLLQNANEEQEEILKKFLLKNISNNDNLLDNIAFLRFIESKKKNYPKQEVLDTIVNSTYVYLDLKSILIATDKDKPLTKSYHIDNEFIRKNVYKSLMLSIKTLTLYYNSIYKQINTNISKLSESDIEEKIKGYIEVEQIIEPTESEESERSYIDKFM